MNWQKLRKEALQTFPKGTQFTTEQFPTCTFTSSGDIAGSCFRKNTDHFISMWLDDGENVPVYLNGVWAN